LRLIKETELYAPLRDFFAGLGYVVHAEAGHCDMILEKDGTVLAIELKRSLSVLLLTQAVLRQRWADLVYIAVPRPRCAGRSRSWSGVCHLARRLELGLITVDLRRESPAIAVHVEPQPFDRGRSIRASKRQRGRILDELRRRTGNYNVGGSKGAPLVTAYRESALHIARCIDRFGASSPSRLRQLGTGPKTAAILQKNVYGWFQRISRGLYGLTSAGRTGLEQFATVLARIDQRIDVAQGAAEDRGDRAGGSQDRSSSS